MTLFNRAVRAASVAVAAALAFSPLLLSGPAAATDTTSKAPASLSGDAACVTGGGWKATWTFTNHSPLPVEVVEVDGPLKVTVPMTVAAGANVSDSAEMTDDTKSATLTVTYRLVRPVDVKTSEPKPFVVVKTIHRCACPTTAPTTSPPPTATTQPTATPATTAPTVPTTPPTTTKPTPDSPTPTPTTPTPTAPTTQPTTASPTSTVPPVTGGTGTGGGDEDSLPLTGPSLILFGTVGIAAVLAGAGALWLSRRRARFTA